MGESSDAAGNAARRRTGGAGAFVASSSALGHTLPEGTRIGGLEIIGLIGEGGFGIVYLAYDDSLQREVAVKEYMPSSLAARASGSLTVTVKSERHADTFKAGLRSFVNEARLLARFDHPSLLKVYRFWEANGTAYMAMPYYEGLTLKATLAAMRRPPDEARLREWLGPLLDALTVMHETHCFHRDIAPDNILLTRDGPVLLDFGAARHVIGDMTHALTVVLKPGYAPIEQYGDTAVQQGAWTDLYALACVVYYAVTGRTPISSVERMLTGDGLEPLSRVAAGRYSEPFLRAVDKALSIQPKDRPQDVAQFRALMDGAAVPAAKVVATDDATIPPVVTKPPGIAPSSSGEGPAWGQAASAPAARSHPDLPPEEEREIHYTPRAAWLAAAGSIVAAAIATWLIIKPAPPTAPPVASALPAQPAPALSLPEPTPTATIENASLPVTTPTATIENASLPVTTTSGTREPAAADLAASAATALGLPAFAEPLPKAAPPAPKRSTRVSAAPPPAMNPKPARCSDILQKASLEPLTADEAAFLRKECR